MQLEDPQLERLKARRGAFTKALASTEAITGALCQRASSGNQHRLPLGFQLPSPDRWSRQLAVAASAHQGPQLSVLLLAKAIGIGLNTADMLVNEIRLARSTRGCSLRYAPPPERRVQQASTTVDSTPGFCVGSRSRTLIGDASRC